MTHRQNPNPPLMGYSRLAMNRCIRVNLGLFHIVIADGAGVV